MVGRRWPAAGMSQVASNIHITGGRNDFSQRSLSNMQIARLALFEVNEKMRGGCAETKAVRHGGAQPGRHHWGFQPQFWEAWLEDSWICCCCCVSSFASLDFPASVTRLTGPKLNFGTIHLLPIIWQQTASPNLLPVFLFAGVRFRAALVAVLRGRQNSPRENFGFQNRCNKPLYHPSVILKKGRGTGSTRKVR
jgi:hypothetical protein